MDNQTPIAGRRWIAVLVAVVVAVVLAVALAVVIAVLAGRDNGNDADSLVSPSRKATPTTAAGTPSTTPGSRPKPPATAKGVDVEDHTIQAGVIQREYLTASPHEIAEDGKLPVVVALHGLGVDRNGMLDSADWRGAVERDRFLAVFPQGWANSWNMGPCCPPASLVGVDDVAFIDQVLSEVLANPAVDPRRVYLTGFSNGALMSYWLVCQRPGVFAALAPIAGSNVSGCAPDKPISLFHQHSDPDPVVPFDGSVGLGQLISSAPLPSVLDSVAAWAKADKCPSEPTTDTGPSGDEHFRWQPCADGTKVELVRLPGIGHVWPNLGSYDGLDAMLEFFSLQ